MPPNSLNFIMLPHYSLFHLFLLLILLLSPPVTAKENDSDFIDTVSPNCNLPLDVCDSRNWMEVLQLGYQAWCKIPGFEHMNYSKIHIFDSEFQEVLNSRNCSALFNYKLNIPSGSPIKSFRILNSTTLYKFNSSLFLTLNSHERPHGHLYRHHCDDFDIFLLDPLMSHKNNVPSFLSGRSSFKLPFEIHMDKLPPLDPDSPFKNINIFQYLTSLAAIQGKLCSAAPKDEGISRNAKKIIGAFIGSAGAIAIGLLIVLLLNKRRILKSSGFMKQSRTISTDSYSNTIPESGFVYYGVPVFTYEELQQSTNNFDPSRELGKGGFGIVYYGKLKDGRDVAVKRLFERTFRRAEQFKNEIEILTRLRHRNLVSLYGCSSRYSRELLLVYEYIPNGTLGCHLHGDLAKPGSLPWSVRMRIAVETASALSYLHACDIIHRDVKTSNLLLDSNFCVKVADFGLSRLFPNFVTHVSTAPQGTPGYLDPEYHHCYHLTNKSDVYSFGVVLVELISSLPAVDITRNKDEIKLANLAVKMIQRRAFSELVDPSLGFESDNEVHRMIVSVAELAFRCIQRDNELRPCMDEVVEILEKIESGKDELEHYEFHGHENSDIEMHSSLPTTLNKDGIESLKDLKPPHHRQTL